MEHKNIYLGGKVMAYFKTSGLKLQIKLNLSTDFCYFM